MLGSENGNPSTKSMYVAKLGNDSPLPLDLYLQSQCSSIHVLYAPGFAGRGVNLLFTRRRPARPFPETHSPPESYVEP